MIARTIIIYISLFCSALATSDAVFINSVQKVIKTWDSDQHVYVKGNTGLAKSDLNSLEKWLDKHHGNWTILLMQSADGEEWTDTRGVKYYGMDAVENAVGRGLSNKTSFASQTDSRTKTRNGAIFVMFLNERKFSYFASDVYDVHGLGERNWRGNLDAKAISAMRNGGRIIDAVKDTVTYVEGSLTNELARVQRRIQQEKSEFESARRWVVNEAATTQTILTELEDEISRYRSNPELRNGDLANPAINDWREVVETASANANPYVAKSAIQGVVRSIQIHRTKLQRWNELHQMLNGVSAEMEKLTLHPNQNHTHMHELSDKLEAVSQDYKTGNSSSIQGLNDVVFRLADLKEERALFEFRDENERKQKQEAAERKKIAVVTGGSAAGVSLLGFGIYSNRRRRKSKELAESLYQEWKSSIKKRVDILFNVMDRAGVVVGSERDLPERGYEGETLRHSIIGIRAIDKAFILTASVDRALEKVESLIHSGNVFRKTANSFSRNNYDEAIDILERHPLLTDPSLEKMKVAERGEETMLGNKLKVDKQELSFTALIAEFDDTVSKANDALELVEHSWETIAARIEELGNHLELVREKDAQVEALAETSAPHDLFLLNPLFDQWLPAARTQHESGMKLGKHDPVKALSEPIQRGDEMVSDMQLIIEMVLLFRKTELPGLILNMQKFVTLKRDDQWIKNALTDFSQQIDSISEDGLSRSVIDRAISIQTELFALPEKVMRATSLAKQAGVTMPVEIDKAHQLVSQTRENLAVQLSLSSGQILAENDAWNPDVILAEAEKTRRIIENLLDQGSVSVADEQVVRAVAMLTKTNTIVDDTLEANRAYDSSLEEVMGLEILVNTHEELARDLMSHLDEKYHSDALQIDPEDSSRGQLSEIEEALRSNTRQLSQDIGFAQLSHTSGKLLTADAALNNARRCHRNVVGLLEMIDSRRNELEDLEEKNNHQMEVLENSVRSLGKVMDDHRTTHATQQFFRELVSVSKAVNAEVNVPYGSSNPYAAEKMLIESQDRITGLESRIKNDREVYAATESALGQLVGQYKQGLTLINRASNDGIGDSSKTVSSAREIQNMESEINRFHDQLAQAHFTWQDLYNDIQSAYHQLSEAMIILKNELQLAQRALSNVRSASGSVAGAMHWTGAYGVTVSGAYGRNALGSAQDALADGDYNSASSFASRAINQSRSAISSAESEVASIRRQRAAAERERRRSRQSSSSSFGSSIGSSGSSGSSGFSRSSFSSSSGSSSGFSRSGW